MGETEASIEIVPYDSAWPARFEEEAVVLSRQLAPWLAGPIEHIGSTAVPGLAAKPVIDIVAGIQSLDVSRAAIAVVSGWAIATGPIRLTSSTGSASLRRRIGRTISI